MIVDIKDHELEAMFRLVSYTRVILAVTFSNDADRPVSDKMKAWATMVEDVAERADLVKRDEMEKHRRKA